MNFEEKAKSHGCHIDREDERQDLLLTLHLAGWEVIEDMGGGSSPTFMCPICGNETDAGCVVSADGEILACVECLNTMGRTEVVELFGGHIQN